MKKLKELHSKIKNKTDAILLMNSASVDMNLQYYTGLDAITGGGVFYWKFDQTPLLLTSDVNQKTSLKDLELVQKNSTKQVYNVIEDHSKIQKIGFNGEKISIRAIQRMQEELPTMRFIDISPELKEMRIIKENSELKTIGKACKLAKSALKLAKRNISKKEIDVYNKINEFYLSKEARPAFETIVASGKNSMLVHSFPTKNKPKVSDTVIVDTGARVDGYCSDFTQTFCKKPNKAQKEMLKLIQEALKEGMKSVKPGMTGNEAYNKVKKVLGEYSQYWNYCLGHGVGMEVHEFPSLCPGSNDVLKKGMVVALEPGLAIPKVGGARFEVTGVLQSKGLKEL